MSAASPWNTSERSPLAAVETKKKGDRFMTRSNARELAVHLIYSRSFTGEEPETALEARLDKAYYAALSPGKMRSMPSGPAGSSWPTWIRWWWAPPTVPRNWTRPSSAIPSAGI